MEAYWQACFPTAKELADRVFWHSSIIIEWRVLWHIWRQNLIWYIKFTTNQAEFLVYTWNCRDVCWNPTGDDCWRPILFWGLGKAAGTAAVGSVAGVFGMLKMAGGWDGQAEGDDPRLSQMTRRSALQSNIRYFPTIPGIVAKHLSSSLQRTRLEKKWVNTGWFLHAFQSSQ